MHRFPFFLLALLGAFAFDSGHAAAPPLQSSGDEQAAVRQAVQAGHLKPLKEIMATVQKRYPGRVTEVELKRDFGGHPLYEFRVLADDGSSRDVYIDAVDGRDVSKAFRPQVVKPMSEVLRKLTSLYDGRVMEVELERWFDAREVYEVVMLTDDNRLREVIVDARSGKVLQPNSTRILELEKLRPVADVVDTVLARYAGRVLEVEIEQDSNGRRYYEIELRLDNGRLLEVHVDAMTGAVLRAGEMV